MALLILDSTTKSIVASMSGAAATTNPDFTVAYADSTSTTFVQGAGDGALNGVSDVTLVAAPGASTQRAIKCITIENKDTAPVTVTISYNNNATLRTIAVVTLAVGDTWTTDGTFDTNGALKQAPGVINVSNATGTLAVSHGGTGVTSIASGAIVYGNGTSAVTALSLGTQGLVLKAGASAPEWGNVSGGTF